MKQLSPITFLPQIYSGPHSKSQGSEKYVELNSLLLDARVQQVTTMLENRQKTEAQEIIGEMTDELQHLGKNGGLKLAWTQLAAMWVAIDNGDYDTAPDMGIAALHSLLDTDERGNIEYLSIAAATIYLLAVAHFNTGESKKAEKELEKAQKLYERLAKKDGERFTPALMAAVEASTEVYKSKLKKMNVLAHYQVATELYEGKVSAGVTDAINSLVDSISAEGDIHLKMGNYRDAVKFYTKALRYQKRISASMGIKELRISINLGNALLQLANRRAAGEQLLHSLLPLAERIGSAADVEEINALLSGEDKNSFDIATIWKKLF